MVKQTRPANVNRFPSRFFVRVKPPTAATGFAFARQPFRALQTNRPGTLVVNEIERMWRCQLQWSSLVSVLEEFKCPRRRTCQIPCWGIDETSAEGDGRCSPHGDGLRDVPRHPPQASPR